jgi:hypothetical protein
MSIGGQAEHFNQS